MNHTFDLRDEILAPYMPKCLIGCAETAADLNVTRYELLLSCPACKASKTHQLSAVPDLVFRLLYGDSIEPVKGIQ